MSARRCAMERRILAFCMVAIAGIAAGCANPDAREDSAPGYFDERQTRLPPPDPSITQGIRRETEALRPGEFLPVVVRLHGKADLRDVAAIGHARDKADLRQAAIAHLRGFAADSQSEVRRAIESLESDGLVRDVEPLWIANVICLEATARALELLSRIEDIEYIAADRSAPLYLQDMAWGVRHINSPEVWYRAAGDLLGRDVVVAVLDSGADLRHPDLVDRIWINTQEDLDGDGRLTGSDLNGIDDDANGYVDDVVGWDFAARDNDPAPDVLDAEPARGHGTHVAGIIAGDGSGGIRTGVAPAATLMVLRVDSQQSVWAAMQYSLVNGADLLNLSIGWPQSLSPDLATWRDAVDNVSDAGSLVISAAGSGGQAPLLHSPAPDDITTPGRVPRALTVAAIAPPTTRAWLDPVARFSSAGPVSWQSVHGFGDYPFPPGLLKPDLAAPGIDITSTMIGGGYANRSGTSMAVAHVSGVAALMLEQDPALLPHELVSRLRESAWRFTTPNTVRGWGRVDALSAINMHAPADDYDIAIDRPDRHWASQDVWIDNDVDGRRDRPNAGTANRLFARIRNLGDRAVGNAEIRFHYAPAGTVGVAGPSAAADFFTYIGSYRVPVLGPAGSTQDRAIGAVDWQMPHPDGQSNHWSIAVEVVAPNPPNREEPDRHNNSTVSNYFTVSVAPGQTATFPFYIYPDPGHPLRPFDLDVVRAGLPHGFEIELAMPETSMTAWHAGLRGFDRVPPAEAGQNALAAADSDIGRIRLRDESGRLKDITLVDGQPVLARLNVRVPEADNDAYLGKAAGPLHVSINARNDTGIFGGLTLRLEIDEDAARIDDLIYAQK